MEYYAKLAAIRNAYPALRTGDVAPVSTGNASLMAYWRDEILVVSNNATSDKSYAIEGDYIDLVTGAAYTGTIPGLRGVILVPAEEAVQITVDTENLAPAWDPAYIVGAEQPEPEVQVVATGWSGYTTWVLTDDGTLTFSPTEERWNGKCNMANYHKVGGVLTLPWSAYAETITKVVIEEGIHAVGQMAFYGLPNLKTVVLADSVEEVRNYAFKNVTSLTDINLENVMFIREGAFFGCSGLKDLTFLSGVVIEDWAFSYTDIIP